MGVEPTVMYTTGCLIDTGVVLVDYSSVAFLMLFLSSYTVIKDEVVGLSHRDQPRVQKLH